MSRVTHQGTSKPNPFCFSGASSTKAEYSTWAKIVEQNRMEDA
jgi:hypothetical protein